MPVSPARWLMRRNAIRLDNPHIYDPFNHAAMSPLLGMRWQWEQGAQPARVVQAQAELDALVHKASFARMGIPFQVREQYLSMQAKHQAIDSMRKSSKAARRWMIAPILISRPD